MRYNATMARRQNENEWTELIGLRNAMVSLLWRTILGGLLWAGLTWLVVPPLNHLTYVPILLLVAIGAVAAVAGLVAGILLSRGLTDVAGFVSPVITGAVIVAAAMLIIGGIFAVETLRPLNSPTIRLVIIITALGTAAFWAFRETLIEG